MNLDVIKCLYLHTWSSTCEVDHKIMITQPLRGDLCLKQVVNCKNSRWGLDQTCGFFHRLVLLNSYSVVMMEVDF